MFYIDNLYYLYIYIFIIMCFSVLECSSVIHGRYTRDIDDYELSIPHRVTSQGEFVSFSIPQYFKHSFRDRHKRETTSDDHKLYYNVIFNGKEHHVELWPNHGFISPNIITEDYNHKRPVNDRILKRMDRSKLCHYSGRVKGHKPSSAALSICDGLTGYLATNSGHYYIEPMAEHGPNENGEHVHVIYKRRLHDKPNSFGVPRFHPGRCGSNEDWEEAWTRELLRKAREDLAKGGNVPKSATHSLHHYLEVLLVVDKKFLDYHKKDGAEKYILTIMNMVYNYYHDQTCGNLIDVTVVRIIYLNKPDEHLDLSVSKDGEGTLASLCAWSEKLNPPDVSNPMHHDIAVLLTRYDLCSDNVTECNLLGLAPLAGICNPKRACVINEDTGLSLGTTVTHEMGHNLGCHHDDGSTQTPCTPEINDGKGNYYIMAPYSHLTTTEWSTCSKKYMTELFNNGLGDCLNDEPADSLYHDKNNVPPGAVYDADYQCANYFDNYIQCSRPADQFCNQLFCRSRDPNTRHCSTNGYPAADGTKCAENKWCFERQCVEMGQRPDAIDGGWGEWGPWGQCSRTCGGGIQAMERDCTNPAPKNKGRYCLGERRKVQMCNTQPCGAAEPTFREQQCTEFNSKPFLGKLHKWTPYIEGGAACALSCKHEERGYAILAPRVKDGTSCKPGSKDKCISGVCNKVGCDNVVGSNAVEDVCGICNGDGTGCQVVKNNFSGTGSGYTKIATIPAGVRHFRVTENAPSVNILAVGTEDGSHYYLNGGNTEYSNGDYDFGGVSGIYDHPVALKETLYIAGPLKKPLTLYEVFYRDDNPGYKYEYAELRPAAMKSKPSYIWDFEEFVGCSARCGKGFKTSKPSCTERTQGKVSDKFCDQASKPEEIITECFVRDCKFMWHPNVWGKCTGCKNKPGIMERIVDCAEESSQEGKDPIVSEDEMCTEEKPPTQQICSSDEPCTEKRSYSESDEKIADLWHQLDFIKTKHNLYEKEKNAEPEFGQIVGYLSDEELNSKHLVKRYLGGLLNVRKKFTRKSIAPSFQLFERNGYFKKRDEATDECTSGPLKGALNATSPAAGNATKPTFIQDALPPQGQEVIEVPIKENAQDVHLSDEAYEKAGDNVADTLDFCNSKTFHGKEADEIFAEIKSNATSTAAPTQPNN